MPLEGVRNLPLCDELESDDLATTLPSALVDLTKGAFSDRMQHVILIHLCLDLMIS